MNLTLHEAQIKPFIYSK